MHQPHMQQIHAPAGDRGVLPGGTREAEDLQASGGATHPPGDGQAAPVHPETRKRRSDPTFTVGLNIKQKGGGAAPPPSAVDYSAVPPAPVRRPWPVLLAQAMRTGRYLNAQVALVGAVECRSPDPVTVLTIGGRWQVTHRQLRTVRAGLPEAQQAQLTSYLLRDDVLVKDLDKDGREYYQAHAPTMDADEEAAFSALWRALRGSGVLDRLQMGRGGFDATPPPPAGVGDPC